MKIIDNGTKVFLMILLFIMGLQISFGQKNEIQNGRAALFYPLGTTWYYHTDERPSIDASPRFGYIQHRVDKNVQIDGYQAQEISVTHVDWTGVETLLDPLYLYRTGDGKAYLIESGKLRLLYDLSAEVGDEVPLPVKGGETLSGFSHATTKVVEKSVVHIDGRDLIRQVYSINYYFDEGPWPMEGIFVEVIEDLGFLVYESQYEKPAPYGIAICFTNAKPTVRCFMSDGFLYKAPFWEGKACDAYGMPSGLADLSEMTSQVSVRVDQDILTIDGDLGGAAYRIVNAGGVQVQTGKLLKGETKISISSLPKGFYLLFWQEKGSSIKGHFTFTR